MRLLGISDYEQANLYLPQFIRDYNRKFAVSPASNPDFHRPLDETHDLAFLFSIHAFRKVTKTLQIQLCWQSVSNRDQSSSLLLC